jgi:hypothetical protein
MEYQSPFIQACGYILFVPVMFFVVDAIKLFTKYVGHKGS